VPRVVHPTDVVLKIEAACVCGSDLWPYRGLQPVENRRMGHEYVGTVVEVGAEVTSVKVGDFVVGSFCLSDNTCEICRAGYPSRCANAGSYTGMQAQYARVELADGTLSIERFRHYMIQDAHYLVGFGRALAGAAAPPPAPSPAPPSSSPRTTA